jgi:murein DD-endopeptidase MepM/ murein hydrolase activator NlpD
MTREAIANNRAFIPRYQRLASRPRVSAQSLISQNSGFAPIRPIALRQHNYQPYRANQEVNSSQVVSLEPIIRRGLAIALAPMPEYSRATSLYAPTAPQGESRTDLLFPLPVVAPITSAFGWRIHPITGTGRMHSGTDIGAPLGTPVLAAYQGEVAVADWLGGYGMTVILRHLEGTQESRYGHLSEIFVKPGQAVQQGEVIGRVGSTGFSTGPHLHFEWRHLTKEGWVAVDAGPHLEYALANLIQTQQLANATLVKPQG